MKLFVANRLSNGNGIFPLEIIIEDIGVTVKKPGLIRAFEKTISYDIISSVELHTPIFGFTKIKINTIGLDSVLAEGFERYEAEEIKRLIYEYKKI
jgi:hypothetical protein